MGPVPAEDVVPVCESQLKSSVLSCVQPQVPLSKVHCTDDPAGKKINSVINAGKFMDIDYPITQVSTSP